MPGESLKGIHGALVWCIGPRTPGSAGMWPSSFCPMISPRISKPARPSCGRKPLLGCET